MLKRKCGLKRDNVAGKWRKLYNEELHDHYCSPNIIRVIRSNRMEWAVHVACMGERRREYRVFVGRSERKRPLGRPGCMWQLYIIIIIIIILFINCNWVVTRWQWLLYICTKYEIGY